MKTPIHLALIIVLTLNHIFRLSPPPPHHLHTTAAVTLVPRLASDYPPPPVAAAEIKKQKAAAAAAGVAYQAPAWQRCIVYGRAVEAGLRYRGKQAMGL